MSYPTFLPPSSPTPSPMSSPMLPTPEPQPAPRRPRPGVLALLVVVLVAAGVTAVVGLVEGSVIPPSAAAVVGAWLAG